MRLLETALVGGMLALISCSSSSASRAAVRAARNPADSPAVDIQRAYCLDRARDHARGSAQNRALAGFLFTSGALAVGAGATTGVLYDRDHDQKALRTTSSVAWGLGLTSLVSAIVPLVFAVIENDAADRKSGSGVRLIVLDEELLRLKEESEKLSGQLGTDESNSKQAHAVAAAKAAINAAPARIAAAKARVKEAKTAVDAAQASVNATAPAVPVGLVKALTAAQLDLSTAQANLMFEEGVRTDGVNVQAGTAALTAAESAFTTADATFHASQHRFELAQFKLKAAVDGVAKTQPQIKAKARDVNAAKADVAKEEAQLSKDKADRDAKQDGTKKASANLKAAKAAFVTASAEIKTEQALALNQAKQDYTRLRMEAAYRPCNGQRDVAYVTDEQLLEQITDAWCRVQTKECEFNSHDPCTEKSLCGNPPGASKK